MMLGFGPIGGDAIAANIISGVLFEDPVELTYEVPEPMCFIYIEPTIVSFTYNPKGG